MRSPTAGGRVRAALRTAALAALAVGTAAAPAAARQEPPTAAGAREAFLAHARAVLARSGLPAGGVSVTRADGPLWSATWSGTAAEAPPAGTPFRTGPLTELVTGAALRYLSATGRLPLDMPLSPVLEDLRLLPPQELTLLEGTAGRVRMGYLPDITARLLLEHRGGLPVDAPAGTRPAAPVVGSAAEVVASLRGQSLVRTPGDSGGTSRAALAALAAAAEIATGVAFADLVRERLLLPLGMRESGLLPAAPRPPPVAAWRRSADGRLLPAADIPRGAAPALGLLATVQDAGRLAAALLPFSDEEAPAAGAPAALAATGAALAPTELDGIPARRHAGSGGGASVAVLLLPDSALAAVVVLPAEGAAGLAERLARAALRMTLAERRGGAPVPPPPTAPLGTADALALVGGYRGEAHDLGLLLGPGGLTAELPQRAAVRARGDTLWIDDPAFPLEPVVPLSGGRLLFRGDTLVLGALVPPRQAPPGWRGLIGEYGTEEDPVGVHETEGGLRLRVDTRVEHGLEPAGEDAFVLTGPGPYGGERLAFDRGRDGQAEVLRWSGVTFPRRIPAGGDGFRIRPRRAISLLRRDALAASPPRETGEFLPSDLVELRSVDATIRYDIRYATTDNFMGAVFYTDPLAFLQRPAAEALARVSERLRALGYGLLVHDAYRPWHVTKMFWDATPDDLKAYVADPASGSRHNRGAAVDLTLYDLATGQAVEMPSGYDEFTERAHADYPGGTARQRWHRALLRHAMAAEGFTVYDMEWWHFDYADWRRWPIGNATFLQLMGR